MKWMRYLKPSLPLNCMIHIWQQWCTTFWRHRATNELHSVLSWVHFYVQLVNTKHLKSKLPLTVLAHLEHHWRVRPTPRKKVITKYRKIQLQMKLIEQQKWEIKNLKAAQATRVSPQQLVQLQYCRQCLAFMWAIKKLWPIIQVMVARNL